MRGEEKINDRNGTFFVFSDLRNIIVVTAIALKRIINAATS
jgi:hypothetical protein